MRLHDLRHTCASLAIAAGADVKVLQRMLKHASAALTLDRYGHLLPGQAESVAERLDEIGKTANGADQRTGRVTGRGRVGPPGPEPLTRSATRRGPAVPFPFMGRLRALVEHNRESIEAVVHRHRGRTVAVFGSVARGDERDDSDIDFLVDFAPGSSLFDLLHLQDDLRELLGTPVDVVSAGGLRDRDDHIRQEAIPLA